MDGRKSRYKSQGLYNLASVWLTACCSSSKCRADSQESKKMLVGINNFGCLSHTILIVWHIISLPQLSEEPQMKRRKYYSFQTFAESLGKIRSKSEWFKMVAKNTFDDESLANIKCLKYLKCWEVLYLFDCVVSGTLT